MYNKKLYIIKTLETIDEILFYLMIYLINITLLIGYAWLSLEGVDILRSNRF